MTRKSLGKILHDISKKSDPSKKASLTELINKACVEGVTSCKAFSLLGIKRHLKKMLHSLGEDDFNREEFFAAFTKLYSLAMAPDKRAKRVFHPSQLLDGCMRQMVFDLSGVEPTDSVVKPIGAELQRTFDVGTWYHIYIQNILYSIGVLEQAEVPVKNDEKYLNGKADGVIKEEVFGERVVLEIKTMNSWTFSKAVFVPFKKHEFQASLYARELGIKKVLYLYINKDTSEIKEFLMPINEEQLKIADTKMNTVIHHAMRKTLPDRTCKDKFCDAAISCPFSTLCFKK